MSSPRFADLLQALDAAYRHDRRGLRPEESHLRGPGHQLLATSHGDLDCLGTIGEDRGYDELREHSAELTLSSGRTVRVLTLPALINAKERSGRPKDLGPPFQYCGPRSTSRRSAAEDVLRCETMGAGGRTP